MTTDERMSEQQIETLALAWPWEYEQSETALRLAEEAGWPLDRTVAALDALAEGFGDSAIPEQVVRVAIEYRARQRRQRGAP